MPTKADSGSVAKKVADGLARSQIITETWMQELLSKYTAV